MSMQKSRRYFAELNRGIGDRITVVIRRLRRKGLSVSKLPHPTAIEIERPPGMTFRELKRSLADVVQARRGSLLLFSERTGHTYLLNNRGNRPGNFVRL